MIKNNNIFSYIPTFSRKIFAGDAHLAEGKFCMGSRH
jgi:hypothetical protein